MRFFSRFLKHKSKSVKQRVNELSQNEYIYLLQEREFIKTGECIYKIGKTKQEPTRRIRNYPKGTRLLFMICVNDCDAMERILLGLFLKKFMKRADIGNEYFQGDYRAMIRVIYDYIMDGKK